MSRALRITKAQARAWTERYFRAWRTNDPDLVASLFSEDATYYYGPFRPPAQGRKEIVRRWVAGTNPPVDAHWNVIAVSGDTAVVHWDVQLEESVMDGVLIVRFDSDGACREHREWYVELPRG